MMFVHRNRFPFFPQKLDRLFIHAKNRPCFIIRTSSIIGYKRPVLLGRYTSAFLQGRFFNTPHMVLSDSSILSSPCFFPPGTVTSSGYTQEAALRSLTREYLHLSLRLLSPTAAKVTASSSLIPVPALPVHIRCLPYTLQPYCIGIAGLSHFVPQP
jgi:hypothetical protein